MYDISLRLMQSSDPIGSMARNYGIKQDQMIEEQRLLCFEDMARLHRQVKERSFSCRHCTVSKRHAGRQQRVGKRIPQAKERP
jgi:hypothetical protein